MRLARNRDFVLLQTGQPLSSAGSQSTAVAYPLLALAVTHSPARTGLVAVARLMPVALLGLLAGAAADRWDRRAIMLAADGVRGVMLAGPPLGGALFGLARALPFAADTASYLCSAATLIAMRKPFQERRDCDPAPLRARVAGGVRFLWRQRFLRTCALVYGLTNLIGPGLLLVVVVVGRRDGLSGGEIGLLVAAFGAGTLAGSLASPLLRRRLSARAILLLELWAWPLAAAFLLWPDPRVLAVAMLPVALAIPVTDSVVIALRLAVTPDGLVGRVESVRSMLALLLAPLGPLAAGLLLALWGTSSPSLREPPDVSPERLRAS